MRYGCKAFLLTGSSQLTVSLYVDFFKTLGAFPREMPASAALSAEKLQILPTDESAGSLGGLARSVGTIDYVINLTDGEFATDEMSGSEEPTPAVICIDIPYESNPAEPPQWRYLQWLHSLLTAEQTTRRSRRAFVTADALMGDWRLVAHLLSESLDVAWPRFSDFSAVMIDRMIKQRRAGVSTQVAPPSLALVQQALDLFRSLVLTVEQKSQRAAIDSIRAQLNTVAEIVGPLHDYYRTLYMHASNSAAEPHRILRPSTGVSAIEAAEARYRHELAECYGEASRLRQQVADARKKALGYAVRLRQKPLTVW